MFAINQQKPKAENWKYYSKMEKRLLFAYASTSLHPLFKYVQEKEYKKIKKLNHTLAIQDIVTEEKSG